MGRSIESVEQVMQVRSDTRCRRITCGVDTAACTPIILRHEDTEFIGTRMLKFRTQLLASLGSGTKVDVVRQAEVRRHLMVVKPKTQEGQCVCFRLDRTLAHKMDTDRVMLFESTLKGWNFIVELEAPSDANMTLQEVTEIIGAEQRLDSTEKMIILVYYLMQSNGQQKLTLVGGRAQTCETKLETDTQISGTVE